MIYKRKPRNFTPRFEIVSCFFEFQGKVLLLKRQENKPQGGKWGFPAGKMSAGENRKKAMLREIEEETGHAPKSKNIKFFRTNYVSHDGYEFTFHKFHYLLEELPTVTIHPEEHSEFVWVSVKKALSMPLVPDEDECIKMYYNF